MVGEEDCLGALGDGGRDSIGLEGGSKGADGELGVRGATGAEDLEEGIAEGVGEVNVVAEELANTGEDVEGKGLGLSGMRGRKKKEG